jgi:UrcA family protein
MTRLSLIAAAAALALGGAGVAGAQSYDDTPAYAPANYPAYQPANTMGDITVYARPYNRYHAPLNGGDQVVRESRLVHGGDLDLASYYGARAMRWRIERAAHDACYSLDSRIPATADAPPDCYNGAVRQAMADVEYRLGFVPPSWPDLG